MTELKYATAFSKLKYANLLLCAKCLQVKSHMEMDKYRQLQHGCEVCNLCLMQSSTYCPKCGKSYIESDRFQLGGGAAIKKCDCGNVIKETSAPHCQNYCLCSICLAQHFFLTDSNQCPTCHRKIKAIRISPSCSNCGRPLKSMFTNILKTVNGICANMHLLCCYCVNVERADTYCEVCRAPVHCKSRTDIKIVQRSNRLACFCGESPPNSQLMSLSCSHLAHLSCHKSMYFCRICKSPIRRPPSPLSLHDLVNKA